MNSIIARSYKALYWSFEVIHRSPQLRWMDLSLPGSRELWRLKSVSFLFIQSGKFITPLKACVQLVVMFVRELSLFPLRWQTVAPLKGCIINPTHFHGMRSNT